MRNEQMTSNYGARSGGIGFCGVLTILFITLKLLKITAVANWSWWWVLSPMWIPSVVALGILLIVGIIVGIAKVIG